MKLQLKRITAYGINNQPDTLQDVVLDSNYIIEYSPSYTGCFLKVQGDTSLYHVTASYEQLNNVLNTVKVG